MTRIAAAILAGFVILASTIGYLWRFEVTQAAEGNFFVVDRWTGRISGCVWIAPGYSFCGPIYPPRPLTELPTPEEILGPRPTK